MMDIKKLFTEHPVSVNESYLKHMWFATRMTWKLFKAMVACFVHAFFPFMFTTYSSEMVAHLKDWLVTRD